MEELEQNRTVSPEQVVASLGEITINNVGDARAALIEAEIVTTHKSAQAIIDSIREQRLAG